MTIESQVWQDLRQVAEDAAKVGATLEGVPLERVRYRIYEKMLQESFQELQSATLRDRLAMAYRLVVKSP